jgi:hypothetical protein
MPSHHFSLISSYIPLRSSLTNHKSCMGYQTSDQQYHKTKINHTYNMKCIINKKEASNNQK